MITFKGIESGPVAFPGFLSLTPYLTIETIQEKTKKKRRLSRLLVRVKGVRCVGAQAQVMMGKARSPKGVQGA